MIVLRFLALLVIASSALHAQQEKVLDRLDVERNLFLEAPSPHVTAQPLANQTYSIQFTEFKFKPTKQDLTPREVLRTFEQLKAEGKIDLIETISLSALELCESTVSFLTLVRMMNGMTEVGTAVTATPRTHEGKVQLEFSYQRRQLAGKRELNVDPDETVTRYTSKLQLEPGIPFLIGGQVTQEFSTYLLVTISK